MSVPAAPPEVPAPGEIACPRCGARIARDQDWCLDCGAAARTRLAPAPNWRLPLGVLGGVVALCLVVLALAFVALTDDPAPSGGPTGPTGPTVAAPAPAPAPAPPTVPALPTAPAPAPAPAPGATGATGATVG